MSQLLAISALDGRYRDKVESIAPLVSEFGLMRNRIVVECNWFQHLADAADIPQLPVLDAAQQAAVGKIYASFEISDAQRIKKIENTTNHDVKAVEYFVKEKIGAISGLSAHTEFVHFACTSEDINNLAYGLMLSQVRERVLLPLMNELIGELESLAARTAAIPMLSRTHGQAASPTTLGKEMRNFSERLRGQRQRFTDVEILGKMNGAVGNYNAHLAAYPDVDWPRLTDSFVSGLGLTTNSHTTQIEPHDYIAELFHAMVRFNQILLDFDRDIWSYIAIDYFGQRNIEGEVGSSTMPHKVNPIDFENSEGNLGIANALLQHMASKLQVSRWQRDLSDSTVLRNIGSVVGHCAIAYMATLKGLSRLEINGDVIASDIDESWEILAEAVQTVMRKYGVAEPYEQLKRVTRGKRLDRELFKNILEELNLPVEAKAELEQLTPADYIGLANDLATGPD
ncbi:MAG: adenylosuccinate lyase [Gammaproteobacteria bacterium]|nr:adenylosuccinate lyase [Gammaproteobacteria bacterium]